MVSKLKDDLFQLLLDEAERPFAGWDFSYITRTGRWHTESLPWSYGSTILPYIRKAHSLLDMGTGGGEFLFLLSPLPPHTCATEHYPPNIPIARQRLQPLGAKVFEFTHDTHLPFKDAEFDLIINRHESYAPLEVSRILKDDGYFITQQVGEQNDIEINNLFETIPEQADHPWTAKYAADELKVAKFHVHKTDEAFPVTRFYDIGALVFYLKAIPWVITDFSTEKYAEVLYQLHKGIQKEGYLDIREHRFIVISQKLTT